MVEELSKDDDPFALTFLIQQAGVIANYLERLSELLNGDRDTWLRLELPPKVVEVVVNKPLQEYRQQSTVLRQLLAEIYRQRAAIPVDPGDDVLDDDDD
ncbi:hypothetical protein [Mycobacterium malmoense]|uniref:hypothetical protein n=1 Tax=Mycobacterium malmoense TaxID=1780 RepID=UPI00210A4853|nr:hypothetical protein [Mycobacterium malmoense]